MRSLSARAVAARDARSIDCARCSRPASRRSRIADERAASAGRLAALRAELKRRGLDGFIVPRADRHQNEYVPPSEERLAWLTGFTGSAGAAIVLADRAVIFVDGRYLLQVRDQIDTALFCGRASGREPARQVARGQPAGRRALRLRPVAAHRRRRREARQSLHARRRDAGAGRAESDRSRLDRPPGPAARPRRGARPEVRRRAARPRSSRACRPRSASSRPTRWSSPIRTTSPGPSTSAARTSRTRRCRSPSRACRARAGPRSISTAASSPTRCATISKRSPTCASPAAFADDLAALGAAKADGAARSGDRRRRARARRSPRPAARVARGADPITLMKAVKNATEIAGTHAAHVRDGAAVANFLAWFDREAPQRQAHRDRRGRGAGKLPPRHRRC